MRSWFRNTLRYMSENIMENGWADPTGVIPAIWFRVPDSHLGSDPS